VVSIWEKAKIKNFAARGRLLLFIFLFFFALVLGRWSHSWWPEKNNSRAVLGGEVTMIDGPASLIRRQGKGNQVLTLHTGIKVGQGDLVITPAGTRLILELDDGSIIRLNEKTTLKLKKLSPQEFVLQQLKGEAYHRLAAGWTREYRVENRSAVLQAWGTAFNLRQEDQNWQLAVIESEVKVQLKEEEKLIAVGQGEKLVQETGEGITQIFKAPLKGEELDNPWINFNRREEEKLKVKKGIFALPPAEITVLQPAETTVAQAAVSIQGKVRGGAGLWGRLNQGQWRKIDLDLGNSFDFRVKLAKGENKLELKTYNQAGKKTLKNLKLFYTPPQPTSLPSPQPTREPSLRLSPLPTVSSPSPASAAELRIIQLLNAGSGKVRLRWQWTGGEGGEGFKILFSSQPGARYPFRSQPRDYGYYVRNPQAREAVVEHFALAQGGNFYFRLCHYQAKEDRCDQYSEDAFLAVNPPQWGNVNLQLTLLRQEGRNLEFSFQVQGKGGIYQGVKLVWSQSPNPTFSYEQNNRSKKENPKSWGYKYSADPQRRQLKIYLPPDDYPAGTWYFRLCRYRGQGECDRYSNQLKVELGS